MIGFGIIGIGAMGRDHISSILHNSNAKLVALVDINKEKADGIAREYNVASYYDFRIMVENEELDAVVINLPHFLHKECMVYCAAHGLHTLVEKPMAISSEECEAMITAAKENNVKLMIGHVQRYFQENIMAKDIIKSGELGEVSTIVDIRNGLYFTPVRPKWFLDKGLSGGGVMMNFGAHSLDKIMWLLDSKVVHIAGNAGSLNSQFNIEGHAQAFITLENGVTATINYSGYDSIPINETRIYLSKGEIKLCTGNGLWIGKNREYKKVHEANSSNPFQLQMNDFIDCIISDKEPKISGLYGKHIIESIEKVYK